MLMQSVLDLPMHAQAELASYPDLSFLFFSFLFFSFFLLVMIWCVSVVNNLMIVFVNGGSSYLCTHNHVIMSGKCLYGIIIHVSYRVI